MPDLPDDITLAPLPFDEAIDFWADRLPMTVDEVRAASEAVKDRAFYVSRVSQMDIITDIMGAVEKAIADGETLADFEARLGGIMERKGWTGLEPWHTETVFRNNVQTAYSVGNWEQMQGHGDDVLCEYDAVNDSRTRPSHAALDGRVWPMDHPIWNTWWPPNGHRCRCSVNPVHRLEVEAESLDVEEDDPTGKLFEPTDPDGNKLPARQLNPDPGWNRHPGKVEWKPDLKKYPQDLRTQYETEVEKRQNASDGP